MIAYDAVMPNFPNIARVTFKATKSEMYSKKNVSNQGYCQYLLKKVIVDDH
jgi:hypothetical protein